MNIKLLAGTLLLLSTSTQVFANARCHQTMSEIREEIHLRPALKDLPPYELRAVILPERQGELLVGLSLAYGIPLKKVHEDYVDLVTRAEKLKFKEDLYNTDYAHKVLRIVARIETLAEFEKHKKELVAFSKKYGVSLEKVKRDYSLGLLLKLPLYYTLQHDAVMQLLTYAYDLRKTLDQYLTNEYPKNAQIQRNLDK